MVLVLGVDIGSTTTKAALVEVTDAVSVVRVARRPTPSGVDELLATCAVVARECAAAAAAPIAAIGIASMGESGAALDANGRALTPLLRWDRRVDRRHLDGLLAAHPGLPASTGIPATTKPAAVALGALRDEHPEVHGRMRYWAGAADLLGHALTGERATDHTLAARTMLAGLGDAWTIDVIESLGVRVDALPSLRAPGEAAGATTIAAASFGISPGIPVHIAGHDHAVGAWAAGARRPDDTVDSLGTSEAIVRIADAVDVARAVDEGFAVGLTVDGSAATILGGSPSCGAMIAWWDQEFPEDRMRERLAALTPAAWVASPTIVLPYPSGRQCPDPQPLARVQVFGDGDAEDRVRGLLQSLVAQSRWIRETADLLAGSPSTTVTMIGSLARRIPIWAPLTAASGPPTAMCAAEEPVAAGSALLAAVRASAVDPETTILSREQVAPLNDPVRDDTYRRFRMAIDPAAVSEGES